MLRIDPKTITPEAYRAEYLADQQAQEERIDALLNERANQTPRLYKVWEAISQEDDEYLRSISCTPENDPLEFAPTEAHLSEKGYAELNSYVNLFLAKHKRLPHGVTNWTDPRPRYEQLRPPVTQQESLTELIAVRADSIKSKAVKWLWNFRIPMNKLSVLAGNPDQGKSLISIYMIAQVTRGLPMYGDVKAVIPASEVLIMAAEDEADDTIKPRLEAADADLQKVHILSTMMDKSPNRVSEEREAQLDRDIASLEMYLKANPNIRLVVIDPISSFLGRVNMNREQEVRSVLTPLKNLAARRNVAVVVVMHLNKVGDQSAIHRIGGAVAFTGVARAVWLFMQDEADKDRHQMLRVKNNIAKATGGLVFNIQTKSVLIDGESVPQPIVVWIGETEASASDILLSSKQSGRPNEQITTAADWLRARLANGSETSEDIKSFGRKAGHTWRTLQRAKDEIGAHAFQKERVWYWEILPKAMEGEPSQNNRVNISTPDEIKFNS
jgi:putative DNA primase/helicase